MHPRQHDPSRSDPPRLFAWAGWPATWALVLTLLALRLVYLVWLCPYTLVEDEAHYWEWSRRLDLSYYTKGPGVAWLIALATATLGDHAWAVRAPAAIASAVASLAVARLAHDLSDDRRAAFFGALAFNLAPVHHALAMLMTIDGPYLACWAVACMCAWRALRNRSGPALLGLALAAGAGFLLKYTMLLLAPGLALAALLVRARTRADHQTPRRPARRALWPLAATALFLGAISPVLIWNAQRGWPTLAHLLEHLSPPTADTDAPTPPVSPAPDTQPDAAALAYDPMWTLEFLGAQLGALGPAAALIAAALLCVWRARRADRDLARAAVFCLCAGAPVLLFYLAVTLVTDAEGNWALAAYVSLFALVGAVAPRELERYHRLVHEWRADPARPRRGLLRRKPETFFQVAFHWSIGVAVGFAILSLRLDLVARLPLVGDAVPLHRLMGADERAARAHDALARLREETNLEPFVVSAAYGPASLLAFYLPGQPVTYCARGVLGAQPSQYDFFPDTRLDDPALRGRPALLLGADEHRWARAFERVVEIDPLDDPEAPHAPARPHRRRAFAGYGYHGWPQHAPRRRPTR